MNLNCKFGQIIDFRSMLNEATKMNIEEGSENNVSLNRIFENFPGYI